MEGTLVKASFDNEILEGRFHKVVPLGRRSFEEAIHCLLNETFFSRIPPR